MNQTAFHPWLHRLAVLTAVVALLPIVMGALVTTKDAGMAFRDWPSSDGHGMLAYPWLKSAGDKFLEHGHRLGGVLPHRHLDRWGCLVARIGGVEEHPVHHLLCLELPVGP